MGRRQRIPRQWLIIADGGLLPHTKRLSPGSGVLLLKSIGPGERQKIRRLARSRRLILSEEGPGAAARVHDIRELRQALLLRTPLILLSPLHPTASHRDWKPIPRMRAAALAGLAGRRLIALGGMDARRFAHIRQLGFQGWAGIGAWLKFPKVTR